MKKLSIAEELMFCTTRISTVTSNRICCSATGFFYYYNIEKDGVDNVVPAIITNKHVVKDAVQLTFGLSRADDDGNPLYQPPFEVTIPKKQLDIWTINHPDPNVDLCAILANPILKAFEDAGYKAYHKNISGLYVPDDKELETFDAIEEVLMIGYPNGMWDEAHNMPLVRRGITASPVYLDYNGLPIFLIDAACYPGSSGSPVFIYRNGMTQDKFGNLYAKSTLKLIGIQHAVPTQTLKGEIKIIPTATLFTESHIMINLGYIIKSKCILEMSELIIEKL